MSAASRGRGSANDRILLQSKITKLLTVTCCALVKRSAPVAVARPRSRRARRRRPAVGCRRLGSGRSRSARSGASSTSREPRRPHRSRDTTWCRRRRRGRCRCRRTASPRHRDAAGARQRRGWRRRDVQHLVVGVKGGEVQRHIDAEVLADPGALGGDLGVAVVLSGNEQRGDLDPHVGFVPQVDERVEHVGQMPDADPVIELLGERLEVDVGGVDVPVELGARPPGTCSPRSPRWP